MEYTTKIMTKSKICCSVVGCNYSYRKSPVGTKFYSFPNETQHRIRRRAWISALKRRTADGKPWIPTRHSRVCSKHFINGIPTRDPDSPGYCPRLFLKPNEHFENAEKEMKNVLLRYNRRKSRNHQKDIKLIQITGKIEEDERKKIDLLLCAGNMNYVRQNKSELLQELRKETNDASSSSSAKENNFKSEQNEQDFPYFQIKEIKSYETGNFENVFIKEEKVDFDNYEIEDTTNTNNVAESMFQDYNKSLLLENLKCEVDLNDSHIKPSVNDDCQENIINDCDIKPLVNDDCQENIINLCKIKPSVDDVDQVDTVGYDIKPSVTDNGQVDINDCDIKPSIYDVIQVDNCDIKPSVKDDVQLDANDYDIKPSIDDVIQVDNCDIKPLVKDDGQLDINDCDIKPSVDDSIQVDNYDIKPSVDYGGKFLCSSSGLFKNCATRLTAVEETDETFQKADNFPMELKTDICDLVDKSIDEPITY